MVHVAEGHSWPHQGPTLKKFFEPPLVRPMPILGWDGGKLKNVPPFLGKKGGMGKGWPKPMGKGWPKCMGKGWPKYMRKGWPKQLGKGWPRCMGKGWPKCMGKGKAIHYNFIVLDREVATTFRCLHCIVPSSLMSWAIVLIMTFHIAPNHIAHGFPLYYN